VTSWADLNGLILRDSGVAAAGQTPSAQMSQDTKSRLVNMINLWKRKRWLVYHLVELTHVCDGSVSYTFGTGQTFDYTRTDQIECAFGRQITPSAQPNQPDFPLRIIKSREEYSQITLKELQGSPGWSLFYDSGYPVGNVFLWPVMTSQYELHLGVKSDLPVPDNLTDDIVLPPEYLDPIYWNMLKRTRVAYRLPADSQIDKMAAGTLGTIKAANFQISPLWMPRSVQSPNASTYSIFSDTFGPTGR